MWEDAIGLNTVPNRFQGDGLAVALVDTGVTPTADLGLRLLARVDLTSEHDGIDHFGHGSHMAGLIAGDGTLSAEAFEGSAPETNLVSIKVAGWDGATDVSTVIAGIQWAVSHRAQYGIRVLNLSFGTDAKGEHRGRPAGLRGRAGLEGRHRGRRGRGQRRPEDRHDLEARRRPAGDHGRCRRRRRHGGPGDDSVAPFSSRGPTRDCAGQARRRGSRRLAGLDARAGQHDRHVPPGRPGCGDAYFKGSGTSQAAAIVSGVVARIIEADSSITPDQVKGVLMATANPTLKSQAGGAGLIDAAAAIARSPRARRRCSQSGSSGWRMPVAFFPPF